MKIQLSTRPVEYDTESSDYWWALLTPRGAAPFLGVKERTLEEWRRLGGGPPFLRLGQGRVRYRRINLREWADAQILTSTAEEVA